MTPHSRIAALAAALAFLVLASPRAGAQGVLYWYSVDAAGGGTDSTAGVALVSSVGQSCAGRVTTTATFFSAGFVVPPLSAVAPPRTPRLALSATLLDFGDVLINATSERTVVFTNIGLDDLLITRQRLGGSDSTEFSIPQGAAATIPPNGSSTMRIAHTPRSAGSKAATVRIECNDPSAPVAIITLTSHAVITGITDADAPFRCALEQAYPNPLRGSGRGSSTIAYAVDRATDIELAVYDPVGRPVAVLARGMRGPGSYQEQFQPSPKLPSGAYTVVLRASTPGGVSSLSRRLILVR